MHIQKVRIYILFLMYPNFEFEILKSKNYIKIKIYTLLNLYNIIS